jgi:lipoprotein-releasing system permease protein
VASGQVVTIRSDSGIDRNLTVSGIFEIGVEALDARAVFVSLASARSLFGLSQGISRIEIKLDDLNTAPAHARRIEAETGLVATPWTNLSKGYPPNAGAAILSRVLHCSLS